MRDIFVDNNVAKNFCNPLDDDYKEFVQWLFDVGALVVSNKLLNEYSSTCGSSLSTTSIHVIINRLISTGRLVKITNAQLNAFRIPKRVERRLRSNKKDWNHLKAVFLSERRLALSADKNFRFDVNTYPGFGAIARARPSAVPYT